MLSGVYWNQPVCPPVRVSVSVQNTRFCQSAGEGIKSHSVRVLVLFTFSVNFVFCKCVNFGTVENFVVWYRERV